jgi:hypothetical protein
MAGDILVAVESVLTEFEGGNVYITAGQTARAGHPILKGREALFEPMKVDWELVEPEPEPPAKAPARAAAARK